MNQNNNSQSNREHAHGGQAQPDLEQLNMRMSRIKHKILVLSGKGGVGKSTVAVNLAVTLALSGKKVGLLDIDIHGPSIPKMLNLSGRHPTAKEGVIIPVQYHENLKVMSMGFLMEGQDEAVIWRGPLKMQVIRQFLQDVDWGDLDYMIVDSPPGTGDEPLSIVQLIPHPDGAVIVTTPQDLSVMDVRRCVNFARKVNLKTLGVIENMSGFICPDCGAKHDIFHKGGGEQMAKEMKVPFLGAVPIDPKIVDASDEGKPYMEFFAQSAAAMEFVKIVEQLKRTGAMTLPLAQTSTGAQQTVKKSDKPKSDLRIAISVSGGKLCTHFGHCESFAMFDVNCAEKQIIDFQSIPSPGHQPGILPEFLRSNGVNLVITGGMGQRAQDLFGKADINLILGVPEDNPEDIVKAYLEGNLRAGENICDH